MGSRGHGLEENEKFQHGKSHRYFNSGVVHFGVKNIFLKVA